MRLLMILILWTWGLTPTWVNIVGTALLGKPDFSARKGAIRQTSHLHR